MLELNFPKYIFKIKKEAEKFYILDSLRKKYVKLTPEEWVRQHAVQFLISEKHYPQGRIGVEVSLTVNGCTRRSDAVVFDTNGLPLLIMECKAPDVKITKQVFEQIAIYNITLKAEYLYVTNGIEHFYCRIFHQEARYSFLQTLPDYTTILS
ncbi:MAG: type I restriction enzyme HsdR N-terminal domain-containing protein [Bacteroidales bacterium]|nr:type I restriction enzyme HsdR N-terminal domain-containing protein [Bacteroidales bacterium]